MPIVDGNNLVKKKESKVLNSGETKYNQTNNTIWQDQQPYTDISSLSLSLLWKDTTLHSHKTKQYI